MQGFTGREKGIKRNFVRNEEKINKMIGFGKTQDGDWRCIYISEDYRSQGAINQKEIPQATNERKENIIIEHRGTFI